MPVPATLRSRRGLSLLEVAILLVITLTACFLLLPALGRSRETARARYCSNNLRRLYQAMDEYCKTPAGVETLQEAGGTTEWPLDLQEYLSDSSFESRNDPRPVFLTCPSHPQSLDRENPSWCLYVLIVEDDGARWAFRDCARDLEAAKPGDWRSSGDRWSSGRVITRDEARAQLGKRLGPHAHGVFQEWGSARHMAWEDDLRDAQAERLVPRF